MAIFKIIFSLALLTTGTFSIVVNNGGYEDLYIYVQDTNDESEFLLKRIQEVFTEASELMFTATRQKLYFKKIKIAIPKSWSLRKGYKRTAVPAAEKQYITVDKGNVKIPHVNGLSKCGKEANYMYLNADDFLMKLDTSNPGWHGRVILHEWGHLRWGIFDEYPVGKKPNFYAEDGKWKPVSCPETIIGRTGIGDKCEAAGSMCNTDDTSVILSKTCRFCPSESQSINISVMFLKELTMFCDKDEESVPESERHNSKATNTQNIYCGGRSAWEVMRMHPDFKESSALPLSTDTKPEFEIIQDSETHRVFVLDVSGSMNDAGKLKTMIQTLEFTIQDVLKQGSWLGIVLFGTQAQTVKPLTQINSQSDRDALKKALPTSASGSTCIGCGIDEAVKILEEKFGDAENAVLVLVSDGENNRGNINSSLKEAVKKKVIINTIAVTQQADILLADIAQETGGKQYTYLGTGTISFIDAFSETIKGDPTSIKGQHLMLLSEKMKMPPNPLKFNFTIEEELGSNTSVNVIADLHQIINIQVIGPENFVQSLSTNGTYAALTIPGVAKAGQYEVRVSMQDNPSTIQYNVKSTPTSNDVVKITTWLSDPKIDFSLGELPVIYINVQKGYSPVINANVSARVESGSNLCKVILADDGKDPDVSLHDGVYSGYLMPNCLSSGRVNIKGYVWGKAGQTKSTKNVLSAPGFEQGEDDPEVFSESFQRVQVFQELYVTKYTDHGTKDIVSPGRITDVNIYNIESKKTLYGESRNFTISWTAPGDDKNIGLATAYILRVSDNLETLLHDFESADLLDIGNASFSPQSAGTTEAFKIVVDAEQSFTKTAFFAVKAVDEVGNTGEISNIVPIVVATGYRAFGDKGTLEIKTVDYSGTTAWTDLSRSVSTVRTNGSADMGDGKEETNGDNGVDNGVVIGSAVGGVGFIILSVLVMLLCRRRLHKTRQGYHLPMEKV